MKVTQWFGPDQKPAHVGYYESFVYSELCAYRRYWDGKKWHRRDCTNDPSPCQRQTWRGLAEKPKS